MRKIATIAVASAGLTACATSAEKVGAAHVSPLKYQSYSCSDIVYELGTIEQEVAQLTGQQNRKARNDKIAVGASLIVWPALFFIATDEVKTELAQAKGEHDALTEAARRKGCAQHQMNAETSASGAEYTSDRADEDAIN